MTFGQDATPRTANEWARANVKELMEVRRMTQAQLAERLGVSQPWLSKRITGTTEFQLGDLDAIGAVFGLSPADLLCAGYGKWDRRSGRERRERAERRQGRAVPFPRREHPTRNHAEGNGVAADSSTPPPWLK